MAMKIAYLLKTFPKLSETFILNEILELERQGLELHIFSLREACETKMHAGVAQVKAGVTYLRHVPPQPTLYRIPFERYAQRLQRANDRRFVFLRRPVRYLRTQLFHPRCSGRRRYFDQALGLARELLMGKFTHLHAHFANEPTSVAKLAHHLTGCPFSFTAHAKDIYLSDRADLATKMAAAEFVITCTGFNRNYLAEIAAPNVPIHVCYHGVDLSRFSCEPELRRADCVDPLQILSVGRFCEKKGFPYLLQACYRLKQRGRRFVCRIVGFGPLEQELEELIRTLQLHDCVVLAGKMTQDKLIDEYRRADLLVLPCLVTDDGDRDGIPNVLVEAMAMRLPVVSTPVSGIGELVDHMQNGLLAAEKDSESLAAAIELLLEKPDLRCRLGENGRQKVMEAFSLDRSTAKVRDLLLRAGKKAQPGPDRVEAKASRGLKTAAQEVARS
jgi:glycosyltransferase involved in cell wall biosynthesis